MGIMKIKAVKNAENVMEITVKGVIQRELVKNVYHKSLFYLYASRNKKKVSLQWIITEPRSKKNAILDAKNAKILVKIALLVLKG